MKKITFRIASACLLLCLLPHIAMAAQLLIPGGQAIGLELENGTVTVAAYDDSGTSAARDGGIQIGDRILSVNDAQITNTADLRQALNRSDGSVTVKILRNGEEKILEIQPEPSAGGPRLGIYLKQGVTGIGTVTFYDPESRTFGSLGHGVSDPAGHPVQLTEGSAYPARITSLKKGQAGAPGQLIGTVTSRQPAGALRQNTAQGVFGDCLLPFSGEPMPVADPEQVHAGNAEILSTVSGSDVHRYCVEILRVYPKGRTSGRNLLLKVTDPDLLEQTGGIVQGMSGSPIIQDGRLVGAVTHVLVADPKTGYGIFIQNMLDAAG